MHSCRGSEKRARPRGSAWSSTIPTAQVGHTGEVRYRARACQRREYRYRRGEFTDVAQVHVEAAIGLRTADLEIRI